MTMGLPLALGLAALIALIAWRLGALDRSGAVAATLVGSAVLGGSGWWGGAILLTFFVGSTAISRLLPDPAATTGEAKGGARDAWQVLANGGAPALAALLTPPLGLVGLGAGLAAAAADTWATSVGATSRTLPFHLMQLRRVPSGTSGAITWRGSVGGLLGALTVGAIVALATDLPLAGMVVIIGTAGMLIDSLIGAAAQGRFYCDTCQVETEQRVHRCGVSARTIGGLPWLDNDGVNALTTIFATASGLVAGTFLSFARGTWL